MKSVEASIVESLQQQIRMKMILNLAGGGGGGGGGGSNHGGGNGNPVLQALAEFQGNIFLYLQIIFICLKGPQG